MLENHYEILDTLHHVIDDLENTKANTGDFQDFFNTIRRMENWY